MSEGKYSVYNLGFTVIQTKDGLKAVNRVKELERELEIVTKERTHWFKKSQGVKCDDEALLCEIYNGENK